MLDEHNWGEMSQLVVFPWVQPLPLAPHAIPGQNLVPEPVFRPVFRPLFEPVLDMFSMVSLCISYSMYTTIYYSQTAELMSQICTEFCAFLEQFSDSEPPRGDDPFLEM